METSSSSKTTPNCFFRCPRFSSRRGIASPAPAMAWRLSAVCEEATRPSVILLDLMMPIMNGWQFRYEQRQDSDLAKIPVVVVSAKSDSQQHALWLEADGYISKPIDLNVLLDTLSHYCESGRSDA